MAELTRIKKERQQEAQEKVSVISSGHLSSHQWNSMPPNPSHLCTCPLVSLSLLLFALRLTSLAWGDNSRCTVHDGSWVITDSANDLVSVPMDGYCFLAPLIRAPFLVVLYLFWMLAINASFSLLKFHLQLFLQWNWTAQIWFEPLMTVFCCPFLVKTLDYNILYIL